MGNEKTCFVIMPISDVDGYEKGHFDRVYEYLIKPACIDAGYTPQRADDTSKANVIIVDILQKILECDMAICDLSSRNPNVFYELGFRQAFNKKTVLIIDQKTERPFDTSNIRTLKYNENLRVDEVKNTVPEIVKSIKETSSANPKEINSLFQLLSIEKAATLPEKHTLSQDSSIILNAINEINQRIEIMANKRHSIIKSIRLANGEKAEIGDELYNADDNFETVGKISMIFIDDSIAILDSNGNMKTIKVNDDLYRSLTTCPF